MGRTLTFLLSFTIHQLFMGIEFILFCLFVCLFFLSVHDMELLAPNLQFLIAELEGVGIRSVAYNLSKMLCQVCKTPEQTNNFWRYPPWWRVPYSVKVHPSIDL